jgi:hypothetical protein
MQAIPVTVRVDVWLWIIKLGPATSGPIEWQIVLVGLAFHVSCAIRDLPGGVLTPFPLMRMQESGDQ